LITKKEGAAPDSYLIARPKVRDSQRAKS